MAQGPAAHRFESMKALAVLRRCCASSRKAAEHRRSPKRKRALCTRNDGHVVGVRQYSAAFVFLAPSRGKL
jgi:hypothetical protein